MKVAPPRLDAHKRQPALVIRIRPYNLYGSLGETLKLSWALHGGRRAVTLSCTQATEDILFHVNFINFIYSFFYKVKLLII